LTSGTLPNFLKFPNSSLRSERFSLSLVSLTLG
jgi:hypothetical protein